MKNKPLLSIIIPTVGRKNELARLAETLGDLNSVCETIIADQNEEAFVSGLFSNLEIKLIRLPKIGLSYARNKSLSEAQGKWTWILDDDCWLNINTIENLINALQKQESTRGIIINARTPDDKSLIGRELNANWTLSRSNHLDSLFITSISIVYPTHALKNAGGFSEVLGIGSPFGAAEEADALLNLINSNCEFDFSSDVKVFHAEVDYRAMGPQKSFLYAKGFGALCNFQGLHALAIMKILKSFAASFLYFFKDRQLSQNYLSSGKGRLSGYFNAFAFRSKYLSKIKF